MTNFSGYKMGELDAQGKPKIFTIKCQKCGKQFHDFTAYNKHKPSHTRRPDG